MRRFRHMLAFSGLTCLLAALAFATPAQAAIKLYCVMSGGFKVTAKDGQAGDFVQLTGGRTNFTADSITTACITIDTKDTGSSPIAFTGSFSITGKFVNSVCGTGKIYGVVVSIVGGPSKLQALVGDKFGIELINFTGPLYWHDGYKGLGNSLLKPFDVNVSGKENPDGRKDYFPGGWFQLSPSQTKPPEPPDPATNKCTKALDFVGVVLIDEDGT